MEKFDYLVIGGGIAGLTFALKVADSGSVAVLFKKGLGDSSTAWAQGGIAAVSGQDNDSVDLHISDTEIAGAGLCNRESVNIVVREGPDRIAELMSWGTKFDRGEDGNGYDLHREGGHSKRRVYHAADQTGQEIQRALLQAVKAHPNIQLFTNANAIDLITTHKLELNLNAPNTALGAYVLLDNKTVKAFRSRATLVATGGAGKVYLYTSNPDIATGDGIAMCYRAGVPVSNLEFFQFHPTCLFHPEAKTFLITEAMRGEGAKLTRINGEPFMQRYDKRGELAPRDIVARAIDFEMKSRGEEHVMLNISHLPSGTVKDKFPHIYHSCLKYGFDITKEPIPVVPAAHYCCGGVVCDQNAETNVMNLFVAGEVAHTGLHGANRLASNSLLEAAVYAHRAAERVKGRGLPEWVAVDLPEWDSGTAVNSDEAVVVTQNWDEIRRFMWNYVGIVRSSKRLERALHRSELIQDEINQYYWDFLVTSDLLELRNLSLVANLVIRCALARRESRGLRYTIDFPNTDEKWVRDTVIDPQQAET